MFDLTNTLEKRAALIQQLDPIIKSIRDRQQTQVEGWLQIHKAWRGAYHRSFFKSEVFNHYVPYFRRAIERFTVRAAQMVLPSTDFFEVYPTDEFDFGANDKADAIQHWLLFILRRKIRTYSLSKQLFRCLSLYGRCILKTGVKILQEGKNKNVYPNARVVDPYMWAMWPETAGSIDEARLIVEDNIIPVSHYMDMARQGRADPIDPSKLVDPTWPNHVARRLSTSGMSDPKSEESSNEQQPVKKFGSDFVHYSEIWFNEGNHWRYLWIVWNLADEQNQGPGPVVTKVSTIRFSRPQYRLALAREIPGEQYTSSMGEDQEPLQILLNDQMNMTLEGQAMAMAPPVAIDAMRITRLSSFVYRPRQQWLGDPEGIKPMTIPDVSKAAFQGLNFTVGLMDTFSGSSPLAEGQPIRNMPRAGFAVSSLLSMSLSDIRDVARMVEEDVLTPMLFDLYALTVEFVPESQVFRVPGTAEFPAKAMTLSNIQGNWDFNWVGSLQSQDYQQKAVRYAEVLGMLGKLMPQVQQDLNAVGKRINWAAIFGRVWRYGLGEHGSSRFIEDIPEGESASPSAILPALGQLPENVVAGILGQQGGGGGGVGGGLPNAQ